MSENCTHNCSTCGENCSSRTQDKNSFLEKLNPESSVKKVIGVVSGKGGVGKSLVTSLLAVKMNSLGFHTAILDADITGPSIPKAFGIEGGVGMVQAGGADVMLPATSSTGIQIMSANLLLDHDTDPVIWRGPVIAGAVKQFWNQTLWENVDYMFVDMPPGTGDVPLTVFQSLPVDGIIVVTSPQELVAMIVEKAVKMAGLTKTPVMGLVENMAYFECPDCHKKHYIFGDSHINELAAKHGIEATAQLPIRPQLAAASDMGAIFDVDTQDWLNGLTDFIEKSHPVK